MVLCIISRTLRVRTEKVDSISKNFSRSHTLEGGYIYSVFSQLVISELMNFYTCVQCKRLKRLKGFRKIQGNQITLLCKACISIFKYKMENFKTFVRINRNQSHGRDISSYSSVPRYTFDNPLVRFKNSNSSHSQPMDLSQSSQSQSNQSQSQMDPELVRALTEDWDSQSNGLKRKSDMTDVGPAAKKPMLKEGERKIDLFIAQTLVILFVIFL